MPFILGPDHIAANGIACTSKNKTSTTLPRQRRPIVLRARANVTNSRVS